MGGGFFAFGAPGSGLAGVAARLAGEVDAGAEDAGENENKPHDALGADVPGAPFDAGDGVAAADGEADGEGVADAGALGLGEKLHQCFLAGAAAGDEPDDLAAGLELGLVLVLGLEPNPRKPPVAAGDEPGDEPGDEAGDEAGAEPGAAGLLPGSPAAGAGDFAARENRPADGALAGEGDLLLAGFPAEPLLLLPGAAGEAPAPGGPGG